MKDSNVKHKGGKPLQRLTWSEKIANGRQFFKDTADYYIQGANLSGKNRETDLKMLYDVYNNKIPLEFFDHIVNPYNTDNKDYQVWPAKIRPTTILRTNLDQLMSEYPKRPFHYFVSNLGEDAYNAFLDGLNNAVNESLQRAALQKAQAILVEQGLSMGEAAEQLAEQEIPTAEETALSYQASYKDKLAIRGQKRLNRLMVEAEVRNKFQKMFKDWLIAGRVRSYKGVKRAGFEYKRISPLCIDGDTSTDFLEDGEWVVAYYPMTHSDVVDAFYDELSEKDHKSIEEANFTSTPKAFFDHLNGLYTSQNANSTENARGNRVPVYHVVWKGKKPIYHVTGTDPLTGEEYEDWYEEEYLAQPGEKLTKRWVNQAYETYRIGQDIYVSMQEVKNSRSSLNNHSACKLPYNGKNYSDTESENISLLEIGLPFQIMYIIVTRALEMTIAKSKGKIILLDKNVIPTNNGWDEDKFFYYAEALGYALVDRNKMGVDKSFNQYQVLDLSLYDSIKQLIDLQLHIKAEWDDIIGFSRQRKGQTFATDTVGANSQALFQSTVITDMIFIGFEEFVERELQGILDLSKFVDTEGVRKLYNESETDYHLLEIDAEDIASAELGISVTKFEGEKLAKMEAFAQQFAVNGASPSTVLEIVSADNIARLKAVLRKAEEAEAQAAQATAQSEQEGLERIEEIKSRYMQTEKALDKEFMHEEYDRKEAIEHIKGDYAIHNNFQTNDGDNNDNGIPDASEIMARQNERESLHADTYNKESDRQQKAKEKQADIKHKQKELDFKERDSVRKEKLAREKMASDERREKLKASTALKNKTTGEK